MSLAGLVLVLVLVVGVAVSAQAEAQTESAGETQGPGICFGAASSLVDQGLWQDMTSAVASAAESQPEFFAGAQVVIVPGPNEPWGTATQPVATIALWSGAEAGEAIVDCDSDGSTWTWRISRQYLLAGAQRILEAARLPQGGPPAIPPNAEAEIEVQFDSARQGIRTSLVFRVPVGPFRLGGTCWIDDALGIDGASGLAVAMATTGMEVDPFVESACRKFEAFMTAGGAGQMALSMVPWRISRGDGTTARLVAGSLSLDTSAMVLTGTVDEG
ncbi:MAG: hypothetical protein ACC726_01310 [Chloroflexota bacterium]